MRETNEFHQWGCQFSLFNKTWLDLMKDIKYAGMLKTKKSYDYSRLPKCESSNLYVNVQYQLWNKNNHEVFLVFEVRYQYKADLPGLVLLHQQSRMAHSQSVLVFLPTMSSLFHI